jgi:ferredoxin
MHASSDIALRFVVGPDGLIGIVDELDRAGYEVWGPAVRDGVIVTRRLDGGDVLPIGYTVDQSPGSSRLVATGDRSRFGWAVGPQPWKPLVHPPSVTTMHLTQTAPEQPVTVSLPGRPPQRLALFGMRPCDLAALDILDHALLDAPPSPEPAYQARRDDAFLVVVNCGVPASTCACVSFGTGPHVGARLAHDLEITELVATADPRDEPDYVVTAISERGASVLARVAERVSTVHVDGHHVVAVEEQQAAASAAIERHLPADRMHEALAAGHDLDRWTVVAEQCVACGNCTAVCPTCFCTTINDVGDLSGSHVERRRDWESCFSLEFSRLGDGSVRSSVAARYRQWMSHKLGTWHDQFGESGCVGCGRCTTWCPVGIDFLEVAQGIVDDVEAR